MGFEICRLSSGCSSFHKKIKLGDHKINYDITENIKIKFSGALNSATNSMITLVKVATARLRDSEAMAHEVAQLCQQRDYPHLSYFLSSVRNVFNGAAMAGYFIIDAHKHGVYTAIDRLKTGENFTPFLNLSLTVSSPGERVQPTVLSAEPHRPAALESKTVDLLDSREIAKSSAATLLLLARQAVLKTTLSASKRAMTGARTALKHLMTGARTASASVKYRFEHQGLPLLKEGLLRLAVRFNRLPTHR